MTRRSLEEIKARADEFADAFEDYDPKPGDQDSAIAPIMAVKLAAWRRDAAERELAEAVQAARDQRLSWRAVGEAIGTSGEAARQRYSSRA
jgi:FAD/FMN-containing dehydrogenase